MIELWHLLWIAPAAATFGFALGAWLATGKDEPQQDSAPADEECSVGERDYCAECPFRPSGNDEITTLH